MKTALITGICGQDGAYLAELLLEEGYKVIGFARRNASTKGLETLGIKDKIQLVDVDICDPFHVDDQIEFCKPDEIYNLAAQSHVGMSFKNPMQTCQVNYGGYLNVVMSARKHVPECRIYQAGTSEMFGYAADTLASEKTPFAPMSPYAISKVAAHWAGVNARYEANQFVANGILFNHESPLRGQDFVTRKISRFVAQYAKTGEGVLKMGNLQACRDWGHAKDYVKAMHLMLQYDMATDFVIATGQSMSVRKFITEAFKVIGKEIVFKYGVGPEEKGFIGDKLVVEVSPEYYRPNDLQFLKGDPAKAKQILAWKPQISTEALISEMVNKDMELV